MNRHVPVAVALGLPLVLWAVLPIHGVAQEAVKEDTLLVRVVGEVVDDDTGRPIRGARVFLEAKGPGAPQEGRTQVTGRDGEFRFRDVPIGIYRLTVTAEGYDAMMDSLPVREGPERHFILPMAKGRGSLEPHGVAADPGQEGGRDYRGRRRRGGSGFLITREDVLKRRPRYLSEMLSRVPGGMLLPSGTGGYTLLLRDQCQPGIWVDGHRLGANNLDQLVSPNEVDAIEVYHGFELPVEFGVNSCGGILVWTRTGGSAGE